MPLTPDDVFRPPPPEVPPSPPPAPIYDKPALQQAISAYTPPPPPAYVQPPPELISRVATPPPAPAVGAASGTTTTTPQAQPFSTPAPSFSGGGASGPTPAPPSRPIVTLPMQPGGPLVAARPEPPVGARPIMLPGGRGLARAMPSRSAGGRSFAAIEGLATMPNPAGSSPIPLGRASFGYGAIRWAPGEREGETPDVFATGSQYRRVRALGPAVGLARGFQFSVL
jgi:hypothetical protein